eukprot:4905372-Pleurochrysis_carterae.AAC.2
MPRRDSLHVCALVFANAPSTMNHRTLVCPSLRHGFVSHKLGHAWVRWLRFWTLACMRARHLRPADTMKSERVGIYVGGKPRTRGCGGVHPSCAM